MGYETDYNGSIRLSKEGVKKLRGLNKSNEDVERGLEDDFELEGIALDDKEMSIGGYGKLYDNEIEKFCLFIAMLDKKSHGDITCHGEDNDDNWRIIVGNGEVKVEVGEIVYRKDYDFKDTGTKKKVYEITGDKKLMREIMIDELK